MRWTIWALALGSLLASARTARAQDGTTEPTTEPTTGLPAESASDGMAASTTESTTEPTAGSTAESTTDTTESAAPGATGDAGGHPVDKGSFGIGIVLGEPTGISAKLYLEDDTAIQGALGINFIGSGVQANAEYLFHPWVVQERDLFVLPIYLGPGVRFIQYGGRGVDSHVAIGLRGVIGMLFDFKTQPLDAFVEAGGVLEYDFTEDFEVALNIGAGVRYYF